MNAYFGILPFIIYRPIKFQKPVEISAKEYLLLKKFGYIENTITESFWELNKWNIRLIIVALCILFISSAIHVTEDANQALQNLGIIILVYMIPKFIIESIKYYKFKAEVATFNKKVKCLADKSSTYFEFSNLYKREVLTSPYGKFLIKKFRRR